MEINCTPPPPKKIVLTYYDKNIWPNLHYILDKKGYVWYCFVLPRYEHLTRENYTLNGHWSLKVKHLKQLGYEVIVVKPEFSEVFSENVKSGRLSKSHMKSLFQNGTLK